MHYYYYTSERFNAGTTERFNAGTDAALMEADAALMEATIKLSLMRAMADIEATAMAVAAEEEACSEEVRTTAGDKPRASLSQVGSPEPTSRVALPQAQVAPPQAGAGEACDRAATEGFDAQPEGETAKGLDARPEEGPAERFDAGAEASKGNPRSGLAAGMRSRCRRMWSSITSLPRLMRTAREATRSPDGNTSAGYDEGGRNGVADRAVEETAMQAEAVTTTAADGEEARLEGVRMAAEEAARRAKRQRKRDRKKARRRRQRLRKTKAKADDNKRQSSTISGPERDPKRTRSTTPRGMLPRRSCGPRWKKPRCKPRRRKWQRRTGRGAA